MWHSISEAKENPRKITTRNMFGKWPETMVLTLNDHNSCEIRRITREKRPRKDYFLW